jgi:hypothetical protein
MRTYVRLRKDRWRYVGYLSFASAARYFVYAPYEATSGRPIEPIAARLESALRSAELGL